VDEELDRFKRINLAEYAASRGYQLIRREPTRAGGSRGSTRSSLLMRHPGSDDKIVIRVERDGHWTYFSVRDERDNGTIIDFLQRRGALTLGAVRGQLRGWLGLDRSFALPEHLRASVVPQGRDRAAVREAFARARIEPDSVYLNSRGIRRETLSSDRFRGTWRIDDRGNLLFPHHDGPGLDGVCGFEKKSRGFIGFSTGGTKAIWTSNAGRADDKLVLAEAVIDAFSYFQIHGDGRTRFATTGGSFGESQARFVAAAIARMQPGSTVVIATDNDGPGERLAAKIRELAGTVAVARERSPVGKDWNDCLQERERDYIRSLRSRDRAPGR
jgi:hypothetical protein